MPSSAGHDRHTHRRLPLDALVACIRARQEHRQRNARTLQMWLAWKFGGEPPGCRQDNLRFTIASPCNPQDARKGCVAWHEKPSGSMFLDANHSLVGESNRSRPCGRSSPLHRFRASGSRCKKATILPPGPHIFRDGSGTSASGCDKCDRAKVSVCWQGKTSVRLSWHRSEHVSKCLRSKRLYASGCRSVMELRSITMSTGLEDDPGRIPPRREADRARRNLWGNSPRTPGYCLASADAPEALQSAVVLDSALSLVSRRCGYPISREGEPAIS